MITTIVNYLAETLSWNVGALGRSCGAVETLSVPSGDLTYTLPVWMHPDTQQYIESFPMGSLPSLSFFVVESVVGVDVNRRVATMNAKIRHFLWADTRALNPPSIDLLASLCIAEINKVTLIGNSSIVIQFRNELPKSRALWSAWNMPDDQLQYLAPPFDFRVMDYDIQYRVPLNCAVQLAAVNKAC